MIEESGRREKQQKNVCRMFSVQRVMQNRTELGATHDTDADGAAEEAKTKKKTTLRCTN